MVKPEDHEVRVSLVNTVRPRLKIKLKLKLLPDSCLEFLEL